MPLSLKILSYFPPPKFIAMPSAGIVFSDTLIRVVSLKNKNCNYELEYWDEIPLAKGVIVNGDVVDEKALTLVLSTLKKKYDISFANVSIPEEKVFLFELELPNIPDEEIRQAIEFKLEENVPFPVKDVLFDYSVMTKGSSENKITVGVSAVPRGISERFARSLIDAGIIPVGFEAESYSTARAVVSNKEDCNVLIVNFSESKTAFSIVCKGVVRFSSTVNIGSVLLIEAIQKTFKVSFAEAVKLKKNMSEMNERSKVELFDSVFNTLSAVKDEIGKVLSYWKNLESKNGNVSPIEKIILCGADSILPGFEKYLRITTKEKVYIANVWINVFDLDNTVPEMLFGQSLGFAGAIGLALKSGRSSSLLPLEYTQKLYEEYRFRLMAVRIMGLTAVSIIGLFFILSSFVLALIKEKEISGRFDAVEKSAGLIQSKNLIKTIDLTNEEMKAVSSKEQFFLYEVMALVSKYGKEKVLITGMSFNNGETGKSIVIEGFGISRDGLISYEKILSKDPLFSSVEFPISNLAKNKDIPFVVTAFLK